MKKIVYFRGVPIDLGDDVRVMSIDLDPGQLASLAAGEPVVVEGDPSGQRTRLVLLPDPTAAELRDLVDTAGRFAAGELH